MKQIDTYQTDQFKIFMYVSKANEFELDPGKYNVAHGAYTDEPPTVPAGKLVRRNAKDDGWLKQDDNRKNIYYVIETGEQYSIGAPVNVGGNEVLYDGGGPVPTWLTDIKPVPPEPEQEPLPESDET